MGERVRCTNCVGERRDNCDEAYGTFIFTQSEVGKIVEEISERPSVPAELRVDGQLRAMSDFTELNSKVAFGYVQTIGCLLSEEVFGENLRQEIITRG